VPDANRKLEIWAGGAGGRPPRRNENSRPTSDGPVSFIFSVSRNNPYVLPLLRLGREPVQARQSIRSEIYAQHLDISALVPRACLVHSCSPQNVRRRLRYRHSHAHAVGRRKLLRSLPLAGVLAASGEEKIESAPLRIWQAHLFSVFEVVPGAVAPRLLWFHLWFLHWFLHLWWLHLWRRNATGVISYHGS